jgi:hypothetical protein
MDFGFARFLEMFEERFGRTTTTVLLGLIGAALVCYSLKVVVDTSIEFRDLVTSSTWWKLANWRPIIFQAIEIIVGVALYIIVIQALWSFYFKPRINRAAAQALTMITMHRDEVKEDRQRLEANYEKAEALLKQSEAISDQVEAKISDLEAKLAEATRKQED